MEFKSREVDDARTPPTQSSPLPPASTTSCIPEQGLHLRACNTTAPNLMQSQRDFCKIQHEIEKSRIRQEIIAAETAHRRVLEEEARRELMMEKEMAMYRASEMGRPIGPQQSPREFYIIQREIEKERVRQEMLAAEIMQRQVLEEEVRRELMIEREMAVHRTSEMGLLINERLRLQFPLRYPLMHQLEGGSAFPGDCGLGFRHDTLPPTFPQLSDAVRNKSMSALEFNKRDRLIILPRPEPNFCGTKQKASAPPSGYAEPPAMSSKIPKEWSCALCQVSVTSAKGLHDHLQGKKHKAKEAALRTQNMCKNSSALQQNKPGKQIKVTERRDTADAEVETVDYLNQKKEDAKNKNEEQPKQKDLNAENQESENGIPTENKGKKKRARRKKLKLKEDVQSLQAEKTADSLNQKNEDLKNKDEELPEQKDLDAENQENKNGIPTEKKEKKKRSCRKKLKLTVRVQTRQAKKKIELQNQKDLNAEDQKNENGMPAVKREKTKAAHGKKLKAKNQKNENVMSAVRRGKTKQAHNKKLKLKMGEESLKAEKTADCSILKKEDSNNKNEEPPKQKDLNHKKKNGMLTAKRGETKPTNRTKLKIWCEICQVGANSVVVMKSHKKGKKHMARLKEAESKC